MNTNEENQNTPLPDADGRSTSDLLRDAARLAQAARRSALREAGLHRGELRLLRAVAETPNAGTHGPRVRRLIANGWARVDEQGIALTAAGRDARESAERRLADVDERINSALTPSQQDDLRAALDTVTEAFGGPEALAELRAHRREHRGARGFRRHGSEHRGVRHGDEQDAPCRHGHREHRGHHRGFGRDSADRDGRPLHHGDRKRGMWAMQAAFERGYVAGAAASSPVDAHPEYRHGHGHHREGFGPRFR